MDYFKKLHDMCSDSLDPMHGGWSSLSRLVDQDVVESVFSRSHKIQELLESNGFEPNISRRKCKSIERVNEKIKEHTEKDDPMTHFKANSDFVAFRLVENRPKELNATIEHLIDVLKTVSAKIWRKPLWEGRPDVIQYVYAYVPVYNMVVEFQVGHIFSMFVFAHDSALRDGLKHVHFAGTDYNEVFNFWQYGFYKDVVSSLLNPDSDRVETIKSKLANICGEESKSSRFILDTLTESGALS